MGISTRIAGGIRVAVLVGLVLSTPLVPVARADSEAATCTGHEDVESVLTCLADTEGDCAVLAVPRLPADVAVAECEASNDVRAIVLIARGVAGYGVVSILLQYGDTSYVDEELVRVRSATVTSSGGRRVVTVTLAHESSGFVPDMDEGGMSEYVYQEVTSVCVVEPELRCPVVGFEVRAYGGDHRPSGTGRARRTGVVRVERGVAVLRTLGRSARVRRVPLFP